MPRKSENEVYIVTLKRKKNGQITRRPILARNEAESISKAQKIWKAYEILATAKAQAESG